MNPQENLSFEAEDVEMSNIHESQERNTEKRTMILKDQNGTVQTIETKTNVYNGVQYFSCPICNQCYLSDEFFRHHVETVHRLTEVSKSAHPRVKKVEEIDLESSDINMKSTSNRKIKKGLSKNSYFCYVHGCGNYGNKGMFRIPKDAELAAQWIEILKLDPNKKKHLICSNHFSTDDLYSNHQRDRLKKDAIPCRNLPD